MASLQQGHEDGGIGVDSGVSAGGRVFIDPNHVLEGDVGQEQLYAAFMPQRVEAFLAGINVNIMACGQTGSSKAHTQYV